MTEEDYQLELLKQAWSLGMYRIHFLSNPKYANDGVTCYIGFDDMYGDRFVIREMECDNYRDRDDRILASYSTAEELVRDGWILD